MLKYLVFILLAFSQCAGASISLQTYQKVHQYEGWVTYYKTPEKTKPKKQLGSSTLKCPRYCKEIDTHSAAFGVPKQLIVAMIQQESAFNTNAVSPKGAKGLMQLMDFNSVGIDPFDPNDNIKTGTKLMARLLKKYDNVELALAAYNAGEGSVRKYNGIPPFNETQQYVRNILSHFKQPLE